MKLYKDYESFISDVSDATGYFAYDTRTSKTGIKLPYIVTVPLTSANMKADNKPWLKADEIDVILHVDGNPNRKKAAIKKVESYLEDNGIPYRRTVDWLDGIQIFAVTFAVEIAYGE